jgi:GH43 family beta-xylosidase
MNISTHYTNPVYDQNFPDPFVLKYCGVYWAYCTGAWADGRWFGILRSTDLARWEEVGGAVEPIASHGDCRWAPEVSYDNGRFYLYYSLGDEATMQLRVAVAEHPAGPFIDSGRVLSEEPFAIDAHVFVDEDGTRHLFYATDYLQHSHIGTGTARRLLADPLTPTGPAIAVTRARYDWQVYDPQRVEKGGVRWHTVEGPFVFKHKGQYYQMFSGGNWQNPSYGVSYALSPTIDSPHEWRQVADGEEVLPLLRTIPGLVIGPGHNSAVRGPDNRELFCVYHRWSADLTARVMAIDPLDWVGERMLVLGPSTSPQPLPEPTVSDVFASAEPGQPGPWWNCSGGNWTIHNGEAIQGGEGIAQASHAHGALNYLAEISLRALDAHAGSYGIALGDSVRFLIEPGLQRAVGMLRQGDTWQETRIALPGNFIAEAYHLLRVERNGQRLSVRLDEATAHWSAIVADSESLPFSLYTNNGRAAFAGFALTEGWEDWFSSAGDWGWQGSSNWQVADGAFVTQGNGEPIFKGPLPAAYRLAINARLLDGGGNWSFYPAAQASSSGPQVAVEQSATGAKLRIYNDEQIEEFALPEGFAPNTFQQLRATIANGILHLSWEGLELGAVHIAPGGTLLGLAASGPAAFDLVRVTAMPHTTKAM